MATTQIDDRATAVVQRPPRRPRPRSEYWDYATAGWRNAGQIPVPRRGD
jgi:hypothetical protein